MLLCIAHDPGVRLRDIAARTGVTERTAYGIVTDLTEAGYVVKHEDSRRNRCQIQAHLPLPETDSRNAPSARSWCFWPAPTMKRPHDSGRLDRGTAPSAPTPGHARHGHHPAVRQR
jgi:IclR helix-turn-helix domain